MTAIYARQSVDKKDSISIEGQINLCEKEAEDADIEIYSDKGFSGANMNRPSFKRMMSDIQDGKINKVVVYRLDRISRSLLDFAGMINTFKKHNVTFISCSEKFDTSTPIGNAMLSIIMVFAQLERETIQQRIRDNYYQRGKKGMYLGGPAPYGFDKEKTEIDGIRTSLLIPNTQAKIVEEMFSLYNSGLSLGKIAHSLSERNIPAPNGGAWPSLAVSRILKSPIYVKADADVYMYYTLKGCTMENELSEYIGTNGCYLYGKRDRSAAKYTDVTNHTVSLAPHQGIVDSEVWLSAQSKLEKNVQIKNTGKSTHTWLSGLTKCSKCGYTMTVINYRGPKKSYTYFSCRGKSNYHVCEGNKTIYVEDVENYVSSAIKEKAHTLHFENEKKVASNQDKIKMIELDNQISNLITSLATASTVSAEYINKRITELHEEKEKLMKNALADSQSGSEHMRKIKNDAEHWDELSFEDKKITAKSLIKKVNLSDNSINVEWKY